MIPKGLVAVVTGGTGALGRVVVKDLAGMEARIVVPYRDEGLKTETIGFVGNASDLTFVRADLTKEAEVQTLVNEALAKHGRIDVLLNFAGGYIGGKEVQNTTEAEWEQNLQINLKTAFLCCRAVIPIMLKQDSGCIVNVTAKPGVEKRSRVKSSAYAVSKAGVAVLTETIAEELKKTNVRVNAIAPSTIDTPENRRDIPQGDFSKWVKLEDVSKVVIFLISGDSAPISGALVPVYGKA